MFGDEIEICFRPHFFPFTEPSFEIDIKPHVKGEEPKWIKVASCGMVDPAVFEQICDNREDQVFSPDSMTGFAFGMGLDRLAMITPLHPKDEARSDTKRGKQIPSSHSFFLSTPIPMRGTPNSRLGAQ